MIIILFILGEVSGFQELTTIFGKEFVERGKMKYVIVFLGELGKKIISCKRS
jgi:hypothetical protein